MLGSPPIQVSVEPSRFYPGWLLARAAVGFARHGGVQVLVTGAAFSPTASLARQRALNEVRERFHAHFEVMHSTGAQDVRSVRLDGQSSDAVSVAEVSVGSGLNDASGLACRPTVHEAIEHGVFEVIERHVLATWWYAGGSLTKINVGPTTVWPSECGLATHYTVSGFNLPVVITTIYDTANHILVCGSSLRRTYAEALSHALSEAAMLYEGVRRGATERLSTHRPESDRRVKLLRNDVSHTRQERFVADIRSQVRLESLDSGRPVGVNEVLRVAGMTGRDAWYCVLHASRDYVVTRVVAPQLVTLKAARCGVRQREAHEDPFC